MSFYFPEGSKFYFSRTFAAAKTISAFTNDNPGEATSAAHGFSNGAELLITSGWEDLNESVVRAAAVTTNTFDAEGVDTTDLDFYPAGSGTGTASLISSWVEIPQILTPSTSGGDARFTTIALLSRRNDINVPTGFNPQSITLTMAHDPANANYKTMIEVSRRLEQVAFKVVIGGGMVGYGFGYLSVSEMPQLNRNQVNQVNASFSLSGKLITYA